MAFTTGTILQARSLGAFRGGLQPVFELPLIKRLDVSATGLTEFLQPNTLAFRVINTGAGSCYFKVNLTGDNAVAATNDTVSIPLAAGAYFDFALPKDIDPATVKLSFI